MVDVRENAQEEMVGEEAMLGIRKRPANREQWENEMDSKPKKSRGGALILQGLQVPEDDDLASVSKLTIGGEHFGASLKSLPEGRARYKHIFIPDKDRTGIAHALHIKKHDELLLFDGMAVTIKDQPGVLNMFREIPRDSEKCITLVICRMKRMTEKFLKITFSLIYTDEMVKCGMNKSVTAISKDSPVVAVDLQYSPKDITGKIECGMSFYARNKNGQLTCQALNNADDSFTFAQSVFTGSCVDKTAMKFEKQMTISCFLCVFKTGDTGQYITINPDKTITLISCKLVREIPALTKDDGRFFYIHKSGSTMYLESASHGRHFLFYDDGVFSLRYCDTFEDVQVLRNQTDFRFYDDELTKIEDPADVSADDNIGPISSSNE